MQYICMVVENKSIYDLTQHLLTLMITIQNGLPDKLSQVLKEHANFHDKHYEVDAWIHFKGRANCDTLSHEIKNIKEAVLL